MPRNPFPATSESPVPSKHNELYKFLFSQNLAVKDLLTGHCTRWAQIGSIDLRALKRLSNEFISPALVRRAPDLIWKAPYKNSDYDFVLLLEFQSKIDPGTAARVDKYTNLTLEELLRQNPDRFPLFLALVIYNGTTLWPPDSVVPACDLRLEADQIRLQRYHVLDLPRLGTQDLPKPNVMSSVATLEANPSREMLLQVIEEAKDRFRGSDQDEIKIREAFRKFC